MLSASTISRGIFAGFNAVLSLAYPLIVGYILTQQSTATTAFAWLLLGIGALRLVLSLKKQSNAAIMPAWLSRLMSIGMMAIGLWVALSQQTMTFQVYPLLISGSLFIIFALSLRRETSIIERFAAVYEKNITPKKRLYMRKVTLLWCIFFSFNLVVSTITWLAMSATVWTWYNGVISYLLMGTLFIGEYLYRRCIFLRKEK